MQVLTLVDAGQSKLLNGDVRRMWTQQICILPEAKKFPPRDAIAFICKTNRKIALDNLLKQPQVKSSL